MALFPKPTDEEVLERAKLEHTDDTRARAMLMAERHKNNLARIRQLAGSSKQYALVDLIDMIIEEDT